MSAAVKAHSRPDVEYHRAVRDTMRRLGCSARQAARLVKAQNPELVRRYAAFSKALAIFNLPPLIRAEESPQGD